ncbi:septal ring lytic transglycosylase RlpA family protein [Lipingzhangella sp. LS1_29]|uniref:Probable endolytic peptidoglycan transglycosylase RlpA n=1 Tax=Lipingzhangella rawalii TaxID=2055835 RepID=A0ABU2H2S3_9ACTN|nr:septal ring lytic transglycosylase RlpA family protein [Lipingzhangella rawalii]MDS1269120.1 septal ring lytic transglycosylase RlpA family protein [Lipingzhangella rawalii]
MRSQPAAPSTSRRRRGPVALGVSAATVAAVGSMVAWYAAGSTGEAPPPSSAMVATPSLFAEDASLADTALPTSQRERAERQQDQARARGHRSTEDTTEARPGEPAHEDGAGRCEASNYSNPQPTANGERFDPDAMTAAHRTLPFDTRVEVTNPDTGAQVTVRINDRGPFIEGRCLDLSRAAFDEIADLDQGITTVEWTVVQ